MSALSVTPSTFTMASTETLPLEFDCTPLLVGAEAVTSPACVLTDLSTNLPYAGGLSGAPSNTDTSVTQTVSALQAAHRYRLAVTFTAKAGKIWTLELEIVCPF